jgi:hypothetical protein
VFDRCGYPRPSQPSLSPISAPPTAPQYSPQPPITLTPSGRSFTIGGKVRNVSPNPANPIILFWPDNEPFPEEGQCRPPSLAFSVQVPNISAEVLGYEILMRYFDTATDTEHGQQRTDIPSTRRLVLSQMRLSELEKEESLSRMLSIR